MQIHRATNQARRRAAVATTLAALVAAVLAPGGLAAPTEEYVPFVTDFPAAAEPYVPFVTDFPKPASPPPAPAEAAAASPALEWSNVVVGGGLAVALALLVAVSWLASGRRAAPA